MRTRELPKAQAAHFEEVAKRLTRLREDADRLARQAGLAPGEGLCGHCRHLIDDCRAAVEALSWGEVGEQPQRPVEVPTKTAWDFLEQLRLRNSTGDATRAKSRLWPDLSLDALRCLTYEAASQEQERLTAEKSQNAWLHLRTAGENRYRRVQALWLETWPNLLRKDLENMTVRKADEQQSQIQNLRRLTA